MYFALLLKLWTKFYHNEKRERWLILYPLPKLEFGVLALKAGLLINELRRLKRPCCNLFFCIEGLKGIRKHFILRNPLIKTMLGSTGWLFYVKFQPNERESIQRGLKYRTPKYRKQTFEYWTFNCPVYYSNSLRLSWSMKCYFQ